jgi:hypothetical protein
MPDRTATITCAKHDVAIDVDAPDDVELTHCPACGRGLR